MKWPRTGMPFNFGAILVIMGILILTQSIFIISISHNSDLWWLVIETIDKSPWNLIISYIMLGCAIWSIGSGIVIMIIAYNNPEFPNQKTIEKLEKNTDWYFFMIIISLITEFTATGMILLSYYKIIPLLISYNILSGIVFASLAGIILFNFLNKRQKTTNKSLH